MADDLSVYSEAKYEIPALDKHLVPLIGFHARRSMNQCKKDLVLVYDKTTLVMRQPTEQLYRDLISAAKRLYWFSHNIGHRMLAVKAKADPDEYARCTRILQLLDDITDFGKMFEKWMDTDFGIKMEDRRVVKKEGHKLLAKLDKLGVIKAVTMEMMEQVEKQQRREVAYEWGKKKGGR